MSLPFTVYCIPGLGLSPEIFKHLRLEVEAVHYLSWLPPEYKESLESYVQRMAQGIAPHPKRLVLIGHSFGGVIAQELSKILEVEHIILISSVKAKKEKNMGINVLMRAFPVHRLVTQKIITQSFKSWGSKHGYDTEEAQAVFLRAAATHSNYYFRWATSKIIAWESKNVVTPITHLHGTRDKTFSFKRILHPVLAVEGGTHFMVFNKAHLISRLINETLYALCNNH